MLFLILVAEVSGINL